ncbi:2-hydroxyacid dehydrogenase [Hoeflea sp. G2-23]|uniref:2-hydroxyacid dehydrogenase n=1 Tax=Hoeflea algicola TaxID=2983763 RepID=A0ABT3ZEF5_9HYPH|nr:2-hydroxyacid dehydrogenase [Hoeflea algicola]MCY0150180.1 2-hydroxyacid dehydrogenase [Hoeflea algicola]
MPKPEIVFVGGGPDWYIQRFADDFILHRLHDGDASKLEQDVRERVRAILAAGPVTELLINSLPKLELIVNAGAGYDKIDMDAAIQRSIAVTNTPDVTDACVADLALALILATARDLIAGDRFVRSGRWLQEGYPLVRKVGGRRVGILGMGRIGRAIAKRAAAFDMSIGYHNRRPVPDQTHTYFDSLIKLANWSDILVVACPGGRATYHLIDRAVLEALGSDGIIVNISRGSVIDEQAMINALDEGTIAGAGLDVFEHEPAVPQRLLQMDNVVLMPHRGGGTIETWEDACDLAKANLSAFFAGQPLMTPINAR